MPDKISKILTDLSKLTPDELAKIANLLNTDPKPQKRRRTRKNKNIEVQPEVKRKRSRKPPGGSKAITNKFYEMEEELNKAFPINSKEFIIDRKIAKEIKNGEKAPLQAFGGDRPNNLVEINCRMCNKPFEVQKQLIWRDDKENKWIYECNDCQIRKRGIR